MPFRVPLYRTIPITNINSISQFILNIINETNNDFNFNKTQNLYTRYKLSKLTKDYECIMSLKPVIPIIFIKYFIRKIPNFSIFLTLKRILILLYFL